MHKKNKTRQNLNQQTFFADDKTVDPAQINVPADENLDQTGCWRSSGESRGLQRWRCQMSAACRLLVRWGLTAHGWSWLMWHLFLKWPVWRPWSYRLDFLEDSGFVRLARDRSRRHMDEQDIQERINVNLIGGIILFHQVYLIKTILSKLLDKALYPRFFEKQG